LINNQRSFEVDGEVGRFSFQTHSVEKDGEIICNTAESVFPAQGAREKYKTSGFKEISMIHGTTERSYRETTALINRIRHQEGATPMRTLQDNTEKEGGKLLDFLEEKTKAIFDKNNFTEEGIPENTEKYADSDVALIPEKEIKEAIESCGLSADQVAEIEKNPVCYEDSAQTVNISIDDVLVKKQKENRAAIEKEKSEGGKRKSIPNTIAQIQKDDKFYTVNGYGLLATLRIVIAFLVNNDLLKHRLQFFMDGERKLRASIFKAFSWFSNIGIILDWYHLNKKCKELLSMALKGRAIRNDVLSELMPLLWYGMVDKAIEYLSGLNEELIKNQDVRDNLINYIERNRPYIPCYAVRKKLGLRNSSNIVEKMNDLIVSDRQKHNGMSWSRSGTVALAALTALKRNKEYANWFEDGDLKFKLAA
jgi:hypothetical protein